MTLEDRTHRIARILRRLFRADRILIRFEFSDGNSINFEAGEMR